MPYPSKKTDFERAAIALRKALKTASELLEDPDEQVKLRAVHAVAQSAGALIKVAEASDLEERLKALESIMQKRTA